MKKLILFVFSLFLLSGIQTIYAHGETSKHPVVRIMGINKSLPYNGTGQTVTPDFEILSDELTDEQKALISCTGTVSGVNAGKYPYELSADQFIYDGDDMQPVFEIVEDGGLIIEKINTVVTVTGINAVAEYDGAVHVAAGYTAEADSDLYDVKRSFVYTGYASATQEEPGISYMGLSANKFRNINPNFSVVKFDVIDGYQQVNPIHDDADNR